MRNYIEEWQREYIRRNHLVESVKVMGKKINMSDTAIRKQCRDEGLETLDTRVKFSKDVKMYVRENMYRKPLIQLAVDTGLRYEQVEALVGRLKQEEKPKGNKDDEMHKYNLCMFLLIGDTVEKICRLCSPKGHQPSDFMEALKYKNGNLVKRAYINIVDAGNKIRINEGGIIGDTLRKIISEMKARRC